MGCYVSTQQLFFFFWGGGGGGGSQWIPLSRRTYLLRDYCVNWTINSKCSQMSVCSSWCSSSSSSSSVASESLVLPSPLTTRNLTICFFFLVTHCRNSFSLNFERGSNFLFLKHEWFLPVFTCSASILRTTDATWPTSCSSLFLEWALVPMGTLDCLSKASDISCNAVTDLAARITDCSVRLGPIFFTISLNNLFMCSLCKSQGMFLPNPPCVLMKRFHFSWCESAGGRATNWNWSRSASHEYLVLPPA